MIKAVIFDLGGVVFRDGTKYAIQEMKERLKFSEELATELLMGQESQDFRKGLLTSKEFWEYVQSKIPPEIKASEIRSLWYNNYVTFPGILELFKKLKSKFKLGIISGNIKERVEYLNKKYDFRKYFDVEVYSFDMRITKPDTLMWKKSLELFNLNAEECIYIDDNPESVGVANSLGFKAIQFKNVPQVKKELIKLDVEVD